MKLKSPKILFPLFMALFMAFFMSGVMTFANIGLQPNFFFLWMRAFAIGFCVAFPVAFFVAPMVQKIVGFICK
jgi:hypothetical protein